MSLPPQPQAPNSDAFQGDLLNRKSAVEVYSTLLHQVGSPCVFALDAGWGAGKTTFIKFWEAHLRNEGFEVMVFNAWESEPCADPLFSLISELASVPDVPEDHKKRMKSKAEGLLRVLGVGLSDVIKNATLVDLQLLKAEWQKEFGDEQGEHQNKHPRLQSHDDLKGTVAEFVVGLAAYAKRIFQLRGERPFVVFVDEIDRCRPTHAIELLECAKHLFQVKNIIFVLAVNKSELANSLQAIYGNKFNADGYLRRIFDHELILPKIASDRKNFVTEWYAKTGIQNRLAKSRDYAGKEQNEISRDILAEFLATSDLEVRDIEQTLSRLGLVFASVHENVVDYALVTTVAMVLRALHPTGYKKFASDEATDLEVFNEISSFPQWALISDQIRALFAATLIAITVKRKGDNYLSDNFDQSSLWKEFLRQAKQAEPADRTAFAKDVIRYAEGILNTHHRGIDFGTVIQRINLLHPRS